MNKAEAKSLIENVFGNAFSKDSYARFARNLFSDLDEGDLWHQPRSGQYIREAYRDYIKSYNLIGRANIDGKQLAVLEVKVKSGKKVDGPRTALRNFVSDYLSNKGGKDAALTAFVADDDPSDWRLSYIRLEQELVVTDSGKVKPVDKVTPARRYSFLVGEREPHHTATVQLVSLLENRAKTLEDIEEAFNVEVVTKSFFEEYKKLFEATKEALAASRDQSPALTSEFECKNITTDHFALKLLSQIIFLYFVQKKGWLGVPNNAQWGSGDRRFLANALKRSKDQSKSFYNAVLEPLFYEALATERNDCYYRNFDCRIPFLNGGLFEPINGYSWKDKLLTLPNSLVDQIFEIFDRFNLTVRENEPLDKEVAVDPEMLGKVFESLISYRNKTGAFYTPQEIVQHISSFTLKRYILNSVPGVEPDELDEFFMKCDTLMEFDARRAVRERDTDTYSWSTPKRIRINAEAIDDALARVTICDPAVGSGAFLIGIMQDIVRVRLALSSHIDGKAMLSQYMFKRECIKNCLHGVDIDTTALDIAKLRLWLSLIVDEESYDAIEPLPNLDYNIMQGNSLISKIGGVDLNISDEENRIRTEDEKERFDTLSSAKAAYFDARHYEEKRLKREAVDKAIENILLAENREKIRQLTSEEAGVKSAWSHNPQRLKKELDKLASKRAGLESEADKLCALIRDQSGNRKLFPWKIYFANVLEDGGFDCIIGNPPYIQLQGLGDEANLLKDMDYRTFNRMGDIYCLFYELGYNLLKDNGVLSYVTSNKWMRAGYGEPLRKFLASNTNPLSLLDFAGQKLFEATVDVNILSFEKNKNKGTTESCIVKDCRLKNLSDYIKQNNVIIPFVSSDSWTILSPIEQSIKAKIDAVGTPLKKWNVKINRGILTGCNDAFIISKEKRDEILGNCGTPEEYRRTAEIVRPILRGRDIKRYGYEWAGLYLIALFPSRHYDIDDYPAVRDYLLSAEWSNEIPSGHGLEKLEQTGKKHIIDGVTFTARKKSSNKWFETQDQICYWDDFSKQKIVWGEISDKPKFAFDNGEYIQEATTFLMTGSKPKYLLAFLNSQLSMYFFSKIGTTTGVGTVRWKKYKLEEFPIPQPTPERLSSFIPLIECILLKHSREMEFKINQAIYHVFNFSEEEISYIENFQYN